MTTSQAAELAANLEQLAAEIRANPILAKHLNNAVVLCWATDHQTLDQLAAAAHVKPTRRIGATYDLTVGERIIGMARLEIAAYTKDLDNVNRERVSA